MRGVPVVHLGYFSVAMMIDGSVLFVEWLTVHFVKWQAPW